MSESGMGAIMKQSFFSVSNCTALTFAFALIAFAGNAQAQIFCPAAVGTQPGIVLQNGTCTNGTTGAYSNATLASQALSDLSQSTTQETTRTATGAIADRRQTERDRCPDGTERVGGVCRAPAAARTTPAASPSAAPAQPRSARPTRRVERQRSAPVAAPVYKAPPLVIEEGVRVAAWARVFGDYERRTGNSTSSINCCNALPGVPAGLPIQLLLSAESKASTVGFVGGMDFTSRNLLAQGDGVIAGILTGYAETDFRLATNSVSTMPGLVGNGSSTLTARLSGPTVGIFATYFNSGFSIDNTFKVDFLSLNENFTDNLAFTANTTFAAFAGTFSGSGSTQLTNYSSFGNVNYRIPLSSQYWIEPTVGYNYTATEYGSNAASLGLANGHLVRLQGGARFGIESIWNQVRVTTTLTGLAYDDVTVSGGVVQNAVFGTNSLLLAQEGQVRGQGILAFNFDFGGGVSSFVLGEVRGGEGLFGAGGKAGARYQW